MIQTLLKYYSFVKDRVYEHLINIYQKKMQCQATYCRALGEMMEEAENKAKAIYQFAKEKIELHPELAAYAQVFTAVHKELHTEIQEITSKQEKHEQTYIYLLESCKLSYIENQKHIIDYVQKQLSAEASKINQKIDEIDKKQSEIDVIKFQSFCHMLEILNQFDENMIKEKYLLEQTEKNFKFLGSKRRQMNDKFDEISALQLEAKEKIKQIRLIEQQRHQFLETICQILNRIETAKLKTLHEVCSKFREEFKPISYMVQFKRTVFMKEMDVPLVSNRQFLQNYKKSMYLLLNPHPQNKLIIDHRESLATKLSFSGGVRDNRKAQVFEGLSLDVQMEGKEEEDAYNDYVEFLYRIKATVAAAYLSDEELKIFYDYLKGCLRKKAFREVMLFYFYELGKMKSEMIVLVHRESQVLLRMTDLFLDQCLTFYDSQSAIKLLMLLYHIQIPSLEPFQAVRTHAIWKNFQFWETSFLESVYEYFEMVVIYYHKLLEEQAQKASQTQSTNWFTNIFKSWGKLPEKRKASPQEVLREFYHEIMQNLAIIYLANMVMMRIPHPLLSKFSEYVVKAIIKLNWPSEYILHLQLAMEEVIKRSQKVILRLLRDDNLLERIMSKLIGSKQKKESVSLSKSISEWLEQK